MSLMLLRNTALQLSLVNNWLTGGVAPHIHASANLRNHPWSHKKHLVGIKFGGPSEVDKRVFSESRANDNTNSGANGLGKYSTNRSSTAHAYRDSASIREQNLREIYNAQREVKTYAEGQMPDRLREKLYKRSAPTKLGLTPDDFDEKEIHDLFKDPEMMKPYYGNDFKSRDEALVLGLSAISMRKLGWDNPRGRKHRAVIYQLMHYWGSSRKVQQGHWKVQVEKPEIVVDSLYNRNQFFAMQHRFATFSSSGRNTAPKFNTKEDAIAHCKFIGLPYIIMPPAKPTVVDDPAGYAANFAFVPEDTRPTYAYDDV